MVVVVLAAFLRALRAEFRGEPAERSGVVTASDHRANGRLTRRSAVAVEADAFDHHLDIVLVQTGVRAHLAGEPALHARLDTGVKFLVAGLKVTAEFDS